MPLPLSDDFPAEPSSAQLLDAAFGSDEGPGAATTDAPAPDPSPAEGEAVEDGAEAEVTPAATASAPDTTAADTDTDAEGDDADADGEGDDEFILEQLDDAQYGALTGVLGHVSAVLNGEVQIDGVPEGLRPAVESIAGNINRYLNQASQSAAQAAHQQGLNLGQRYAVLMELENSDRDSFDEAMAKESDKGAGYREWQAAVARASGIDSERAAEVQGQITELADELSEAPDARARVIATAKQQGLFTRPDAYDADLRRFARLVDREVIRLETQPAEAAAATPAPRAANARAANGARLKAVPKADAGGTGSGDRGLLSGIDPNAPGAGSRMLDRAFGT
jgi:hypothetical protein